MVVDTFMQPFEKPGETPAAGMLAPDHMTDEELDRFAILNKSVYSPIRRQPFNLYILIHCTKRK